MSVQLTISQELVSHQRNNKLAAELVGHCEKLIALVNHKGVSGTEGLEDLTKTVIKHTNLPVQFEWDPTIGTGASAFRLIMGGSGTDTDKEWASKELIELTQGKHPLSGKLASLTIDLDKIWVDMDPALHKVLNVKILLTPWMLTSDGRIKATPEEAAGVIAHELGHGFMTWASLADFTRLNYYLTDGIDVLLGKKQHNRQYKLFDEAYLEKHVTDPTLREQLTSGATNDNVYRWAMLDVIKTQRRDQLGSYAGSFKRQEQLADWFAAALGFARPMAEITYRVEKYGRPGRYMTAGQWVAAQLIQTGVLALGVAAPGVPATLMMLGLYTTIEITHGSSGLDSYDEPKERLEKLRRYLVNRLRFTTDRHEKTRIHQDIEAIEKLQTTLNEYPTVWELATHVLSPGHRRRHQRYNRERVLELLHNNDLFIQADKYRR